MHRNEIGANIKSVNIVRLFPEGKSHYCCLCNNIIASFPNFKRHFATTHKGIDLIVPAKCLICDREFAKSSGAGVHLKRAHQIGKDDPYPVSPSPIMSYVDMESTLNNSTCNSTRSRRSRRGTLINSPLSGITTCPSSNGINTLDSEYVNTSLACLTSQSPSPRTPSSSPPSHHHPRSPDCESVSKPLVAFAGRTDWNVDAEPYYPNGQSLSCYTPLPSTSPSAILCSSPETTVALTGCTEVDDADLSHTNQPPSPLPRPTLNNIDEVSPEPTVDLSGCTGVDGDMDVSCPPIPLPRPTLNNIDEVSPEPTVALSGCTGVDGDMDVSCPQTIPPTLPPTSPVHSIDPDMPFPPNEPDISLTSSPDRSVAFIGCTDVDGDVHNYTTPDAEVSLGGYTYAEGCDNPPGNSTPANTNPLQAFHDKWSDVFTDPGNWPNFSEECTAFAKDVIVTSAKVLPDKKQNHAHRRPNRPSARPVNNNRRPLRYNPIEARRIQSLYRISKRRAARKVIGDNKSSYTGTTENAEQFFTNVFSARACDKQGIKRGLNEFVPNGPADNHLGDHLSPGEIQKKATFFV